MLKVIEKITKGITDVLGTIAGIMILAMMLLAVVDVVCRTFFKFSILGATEIIQILNVGIVVALGAGTVRNQHVTVDFVMERIPKAPRFAVQIVVDVVNIGVLVLMAVCSFQQMEKSRVQGFSYSLLEIPEWPFVGLIAIGLLGGVVGVIHSICQHIEEFRQSEPEREEEGQ